MVHFQLLFLEVPQHHTQLLWNGIPLNSLSTGQVDLGLFPTSLFSEIKLNSGGNSTLSGSGAVAGSIQLNNTFDYNPMYKWEIDLTKGSFGLENLFLIVLEIKNCSTNSVFKFHKSKRF